MLDNCVEGYGDRGKGSGTSMLSAAIFIADKTSPPSSGTTDIETASR
jgi:hypothetical protein